jgi:hypothetical protein
VAYLTGETTIKNMSILEEPRTGFVAIRAEEIIELQKKIIDLQAKLLETK